MPFEVECFCQADDTKQVFQIYIAHISRQHMTRTNANMLSDKCSSMNRSLVCDGMLKKTM